MSEEGVHAMTAEGVQLQSVQDRRTHDLQDRQFRFIDQHVETVYVYDGDTLNLWAGFIIEGTLADPNRVGYLRFLVSHATPLEYDYYPAS